MWLWVVSTFKKIVGIGTVVGVVLYVLIMLLCKW